MTPIPEKNMQLDPVRNALRVLHVMPSVSPLRGGTSTAIWNTLNALKRRGINADLITTDDDGPLNRMQVPLDRFVDTAGHRVHYFARDARAYTFSGSMVRWLWRNVSRYDIVHVHGLFSLAPVAAGRIALSRSVPYVLCPHGMLERWCLQNRRRKLKDVSLRLIEGNLLRNASRVLFTSRSEVEQAGDLGIPMNSAVIPLGLDVHELVSRSRRAAGQVTAHAHTPAHTRTILFLSRIDEKKGLDVLIEAFAHLARDQSDLRLAVAGDGPEALKQALIEQSRALGVAERIDWLGFVAGDAKDRLLSQACVFVLPSRSENFGLAVVEAMAAEVPVVISRAVGVSDLVEQSGAGLLAGDSALDVARSVSAVLNDRELRARMGSAGRRAVQDTLSLDVFGARLEDLYSGIACARDSRRQNGLHPAPVRCSG